MHFISFSLGDNSAKLPTGNADNDTSAVKLTLCVGGNERSGVNVNQLRIGPISARRMMCTKVLHLKLFTKDLVSTQERTWERFVLHSRIYAFYFLGDYK